jgi:hypothetical protein
MSRRSSAQPQEVREAETNSNQVSNGGATTPSRLSICSNKSEVLDADTFDIEMLPEGPSSDQAQAFRSES